MGLDRFVYRLYPLVQGLPVLPAGQGDPPALRRCPADAHPGQLDLPRSNEGFNHLLMVVDCSLHWLEAFPLKSTSTESIANTFVGGWLASFGVPEHITSHQGPQFCSKLWDHLSQCLGTLHYLTTAYHPQAKGMVERSH